MALNGGKGITGIMGIAAEHLSAADLQGIAVHILTEPKTEGKDVWAHCPWHAEATPGNAFYYTPGRDWGYCHSCGNTGDIIDIYAAVFNLENKEAVKDFVRTHCPQAQSSVRAQKQRRQTPRIPQNHTEAWSPKPANTPVGLWLENAVKMLNWSQEHLAKSAQSQDYLSGRGIPPQALQDYGLGLIPKNLWLQRASWGLEPKYRDDGKEKKLWIPPGISIPYYQDGALHRVRVRRWEGDPRYYWVPGSGNQTMLLWRRPGTHLPDAAVVVETELDAIALHYAAGDLVHVVALGSSAAKPRSPVFELLRSCTSVLVCADFDQAGMQAWSWWKRVYPQSQLWPSPVGKDIGDAAEAGVPLREWVASCLPPAWTIGLSDYGRSYAGGGDASGPEDHLSGAEQEQQAQGQEQAEEGPDLVGIPQSIKRLGDLLRQADVMLIDEPGQRALQALQFKDGKWIENPLWWHMHEDLGREIHDLFWFDDKVCEYIKAHPDSRITRKNYWKLLDEL